MVSDAELLAQIYANPDDDALRAVYADALLERGDPRGELITLQLERTRAGAPAEAQVARLARAAWQD